MAQIEDEAVHFPMLCHLAAGDFNIGGSILFFHLYTLFSCVRTLYNPVGLSGQTSPITEQKVLTLPTYCTETFIQDVSSDYE